MSTRRYKNFLRTIYGALFASNLSTSDLKALVHELRRGQLADELSFMIERTLQHLVNSRDGGVEDDRVLEAEALIKARRLPKAKLAYMMSSLGFEPSPMNSTVKEMLQDFLSEVPTSRYNKLMELIEDGRSDDAFLKGIGKSRD